MKLGYLIAIVVDENWKMNICNNIQDKLSRGAKISIGINRKLEIKKK